jgi:hypothetical protein
MTTEILTHPETKAVKQLPTFPGLLIYVDCELDDKTQRAVDDYHADCLKFQRRATGLHESRGRLLNGALDEKLRVTLDAAQKLNDDRATLERELAGLRWRRFALLPRLVPSFRQASTDADAGHDAAMATERQIFADCGVTVDSMPAAGVFPEAAERQLVALLREELGPLAAKSVQLRASTALRVLLAQIGSPPTLDVCKITWQGAPAGILSDVARMAGLDSAKPTVQTLPPFSARAGRIMRETGLTDRPLLPAHVNIISDIDRELPAGEQYRPLATCPAGKLKAVRELLQKLPQTRAIKSFLSDTANGPVVHAI